MATIQIQQQAFLDLIKEFEQSDLVELLTEMVEEGAVSMEFVTIYLKRQGIDI